MGFLKETYVFATSLLFMSISVTHVFGVGVAGLHDQERIVQGLLAILPVMIFIPLGMRLTKRQSRIFNLLIVAIIALMSKIGLGADGWWLIYGATLLRHPSTSPRRRGSNLSD